MVVENVRVFKDFLRIVLPVSLFFLFDLALLLDHCVVSFIVVVVVRKGNRLHYFS